jgi:hypothetical protein
VANLTQLDTLSRASKPVHVVVQLATLSAGETAEWERSIDLAANACGCGEAAAFLLTTAGCLGFLAPVLWPVVRLHSISAGLLVSLLMLGAIAAGKSFGRARATRRLLRTIDALRAIVQDRSADCRAACRTQVGNIPEGEYQ